MNAQHGVPALLSFYFLGLGQLVKGQWQKTVILWLLAALPWFVWFLAAALVIPEVMGTIRYAPAEIPAMVTNVFLSSPMILFVLLVNLAIWLWNVVDAYRTPS